MPQAARPWLMLDPCADLSDPFACGKVDFNDRV
jgi:hypothetical protein